MSGPHDPPRPASPARRPRVLRWTTGIAVTVAVLLVLGVIASFAYPWLVLVGALG